MRSVAVLAVATVGFAATPAIGIITASGHFTLERSQVWGNSTLFDGATVETGTSSSELALRNGVKMQLGAAARAQVWQGRIALQKGVGQVAGPASYEVDAAGLKIHAATDSSRLRVGIKDQVEVTALTGTAYVTTSAGLLLASIPAGHSMSFAMQAAQTGAVTRAGCLLYKDGHFILQDENTQEVVELSGSNLAANTGNRVQVLGIVSSAKPAVSIAASVVNVTSMSVQSQGGCLSAASALNAKTDAPATGATPSSTTAKAPGTTIPKASGGGLSTGAKTAIWVGIIGGAGGGAAVALMGKKGSTSP